MPARSSSERCCDLRLASQCRRIDGDALTIADHLVAGDEDIADRSPVGAPDELQADVTAGHPTPVGRLMDHDVGLFAGLQRPDSIGHPDRFGTGDRRQFERLVGTEPLRIEAAVASDPGSQRRRPQDVGRDRRRWTHRSPAPPARHVRRSRRGGRPGSRPGRGGGTPTGSRRSPFASTAPRSISSSSSHTPWASNRFGPSTPRSFRCGDGRRPVRSR